MLIERSFNPCLLRTRRSDHLPALASVPLTWLAITLRITLSKLGFLPLSHSITVGAMHAVGTAFLIVSYWLWVSAAIKENCEVSRNHTGVYKKVTFTYLRLSHVRCSTVSKNLYHITSLLGK